MALDNARIRGGKLHRSRQDAKKSRYVCTIHNPPFLSCLPVFPLFRGRDYARGPTTSTDPGRRDTEKKTSVVETGRGRGRVRGKE